jgi:hypothetical protein
MIRLIYTIFILISILSCAPSLSPYTQRLHEKYEWKESDLKKVQFYLSHDIVLRRRSESGKAEIEGGEIKIIDGSKYEMIRFNAGTPGVLLFMPNDNRMAVSFENGGDDKFLMFGPNPNYNNRYVLLAADWKRNYGEVSYMGKKWETSASSAFAGLTINLKNIDQNSSQARVARGRTVE